MKDDLNQIISVSSVDGSFYDFPCATTLLDASGDGELLRQIVQIEAVSVSAQVVGVWVKVEGAAQAVVEAHWPNGQWGGIGVVGDDHALYNPAVPVGYLVDSEHIRLRIRGVANSEATAVVSPLITSLSSSRNANGTVSVVGKSTLKEVRRKRSLRDSGKELQVS